MASDKKGKRTETSSSSKTKSRSERTRTSSAGASTQQYAPPQVVRSPAGSVSQQGVPGRMPQAPSNAGTVVPQVEPDQRSLASSLESRAGSFPDSGSGQSRNNRPRDIVINNGNADRAQLPALPADRGPPFGHDYQTPECQNAMRKLGGPPRGPFPPLQINDP